MEGKHGIKEEEGGRGEVRRGITPYHQFLDPPLLLPKTLVKFQREQLSAGCQIYVGY